VTEPSPEGGAPGTKRPVSIFLTVACAVAGLVDLQSFSFAFSREMRALSAGTPWIRGLGAGVALLQIVCLVTLWRGRRIGLHGYLLLALIYAGVFSTAVSPAGLFSLLPAVLVGAAALWNWERLR
jgi:hypothetical protein